MPSNKDVTKSDTDKRASEIPPLAFKQLNALVKLLERDPELLAKYKKDLKKFRKRDILKKFPLIKRV